MTDNENSTNLSAGSLQAPQIQIVWGFLSGPRDIMGSLVAIDQQALATGCLPWKRTVPYSNRASWVWVFLRLSVSLKLIFIVPLIFILFLYICFNSRGRVPLARNSLRAVKSHWLVQKVTLAGQKSHTRANMSHWSVRISNHIPAFVC